MNARRTLLLGALGTTLLLHGLAYSVLPLRGAGVGPVGDALVPITVRWMVALLGFVTAGLGLGVRPLRPLMRPAVLAAGLAGLTAQTWHRDGSLWAGVVLSAVLPVLTLWVVWTAEPPIRSNRPSRALADAIGLTFLVWIAVSALLWPSHRGWGTVPPEWQLALPGDHTPRIPRLEIMHAVTIDALPEQVWPWLAQIGQDRGGFYWGAFVLRPTGGGDTRFLIRSTISHPRISAWLAAVNLTVFQLPHFIMQRRMMLGIKERAERAAASHYD